jgi:hypothetical protein
MGVLNFDNRLMLFREIVAVHCEKHTEHINTISGQNAEFFVLKVVAYIIIIIIIIMVGRTAHFELYPSVDDSATLIYSAVAQSIRFSLLRTSQI